MKPSRPSAHAWQRLSRLAIQAPTEPTGMPFGFSTRVVSAWRANSRETTLAAFEWLTFRGLAVALLIFAGSAAFGYEAVSNAFAGEASLAGGWVDFVTFPQ
jgi:hypothetical protein